MSQGIVSTAVGVCVWVSRHMLQLALKHMISYYPALQPKLNLQTGPEIFIEFHAF